MNKSRLQTVVTFLAFLAMIYPVTAFAQFQSPPLTLKPTSPPSTYGFSVAGGDVNGDGIADVIAGSIFSAAAGAKNAGQVFVYYGGAPPHTSPDLVLQAPTPQAEARFGWSVATGDVNGDGMTDIIVGEPFRNRGAEKYVGVAYVFFGGALLNDQADLTLHPPSTLNAKAVFGWTTIAGDLTDDGFAEVVVGAENATVGGHEEAGQAFLFLGSTSASGVLSPTQTLQSPVPQKSGQFSFAMAIGKINGDRFADLVVGAPGDDAGSTRNAGQAYVYFGSAPFDTTADRTLQQPTPAANSSFGYAVAAGDLNGDGTDDVAAATPRPAFSASVGGGSQPGEVYIFPGGNPFAEPPTRIQAPNPAKNDGFGFTLAVGDANGDGTQDLLVGMPLARVNNRNNAGQAFLFFGSMGTSFDPVADFTFQDPAPSGNAKFSSALALADVNGDRHADAVIAAPASPNGIGFQGAPGEVFAFLAQ